MWEYCKLQIGCMLIIVYIMFIFWKENKRFHQKHKFRIFDVLLILGFVCVCLDGATAYTVNHLDEVSRGVNIILHLFFLLSLDLCMFLMFIYMYSVTIGIPKKKSVLVALYSPFLVNVFLVVVNIQSLEYYEGELSNYSMGSSAYTCYVMVGVYILLSLLIFFRRWRYIEKHKRISIFTYMFVVICTAAYQMFYPQALLSSICITVIVLGVYMNLENPSVTELSHYHDEMVMGFATLVENKDDSTGGHIKRTTMYVQLLSEELRNRGYYKKILTKDYMENLRMAAPMHDIGKISVPDAILQKPGRLTDEEYAQIKLHASNGGRIIKETFGNLRNEEYAKMAYEVACYHHEKWNGKGYPEGLKRKEIPLSARIMAIADVFDALSEKRCYKEALPLDKCFGIILEGSGQDFDPMLVEVFLDIREKVEEVYHSINNSINTGGIKR